MSNAIPTATVYSNGRILTMESGDAGRGDHEALGVRDGRIVARGAASDVRRVVGSGAAEVDLRGATLMPGIVDTHPHVIHFALIEGPCVDIKDAKSHADIVARIHERAASTPKGEWIMTTPVGEPHYFLRRSYRDLAEGKLPDRDVLDRAAPEHPVWIQAWAPVIPNVTAFNSAGLAKLGLTRDTPDRVEHVWIEKDAHGEPTGIPREWCEVAMRFCAERKLRLNVVVAGTGEHDEYLDQLEAEDRDYEIRDRHWVLQHVFFFEPEQALAMWTREAARVLQWDGIGTLAPGSHADLIVVDRDPLTCGVEDLPGTRVLRTVLDGRTVHDAGAL